MFKFIKGKPHQSAERHKIQKELFSYRRTLQHGFPHKPSSLGWDPSLRLICIGTSTGAVKVFGRPGVEFYGQHQNPIPVIKVLFLPGKGKVVSLQDDNSLHLWEVNKSSLVEVKSQALEGKLKKISNICLETSGKHLLLGAEGGNIYLLELGTFTMTSDIIYQDVVMHNVPQDYKLNPGAVECTLEQPNHPNNILIGYNRGLMVLWNRLDNVASKTFISNQQLECLCWKDEYHFISSHNDGSYMEWDVSQSENPCGEPISTYGPYACKAIPKLVAKELNGEQLIVFSGGLPRANYGDKYSVSVIHGDSSENHVAFDFTSKIASEKNDNESEDEYGNKIQQWLGNQLDPSQYASWELDREAHLVPVSITGEIAPADADTLKMVFCNCKEGSCGKACSCRKLGLRCSSKCDQCLGLACCNPCIVLENDEDESDSLN